MSGAQNPEVTLTADQKERLKKYMSGKIEEWENKRVNVKILFDEKGREYTYRDGILTRSYTRGGIIDTHE